MSDIPDQIGPYRVDREIGRGGMGVVYLAHDTNLDRAVAIKTLPVEVTGDAERLGRFEREARLLATLNHANIAAVFGLEKIDGARYLVLEYVEGETLSERLAGGPLPMDEALPIALQIAEAVECAHEGNIVHRDLKPANIKFTADGRVKVLDFGLAKALGEKPSTSASTVASAPTATGQDSPTIPGTILGTAGYMSPEQARGRAVDKRSDIWSFGCILYEILSGARVFAGETIADSLGATLHKDPEWAALPPDTPPVVQLLLRRCLQKDRRRRLQDIGDARIELEEAIADPTASSMSLAGAALSIAAPRKRGWRDTIPWMLAAVAGLAFAIALVALWFATRSPALAPVRVRVEISRDNLLYAEIGSQTALSPDGTMLAYVAVEGTTRHLYLRRLDQLEGARLSGTDGARHPFFSPDGQWLGFFTERNLRKVSIHGGAPLTLADVQDDRGGTWRSDDSIVFTTDTATGLSLIPAAGGTPVTLTTPDRERNERSHRWPFVLPGDRGVLFVAQKQNTSFDDADIEVLDQETGQRKVLHHGGMFPRYAPSGHLVYVREWTLFAAPFDLDRLELTGPPVPIIEGIASNPRTGGAHYSFCDAGTFAYHPGYTREFLTRVLTVDRDGTSTVLLDEEMSYVAPALSPTGDRLAVGIQATTGDIWLYEFERQNLIRFTFDQADDMWPIWTPDGSRILFSSTRETNTPNLFWKLSNGSGPAERLTTSDYAQFATCISPDGTFVVFDEYHDDTGWDIWTMPLQGDRTPELYLQTPFIEENGVLSPDGRWLCYSSDESGKSQVYVRAFPDTGGKWLVSIDGGDHPLWGPTGTEIFYLRAGTIMVTKVTTEGPIFLADRPDILLDDELVFEPIFRPYTVSDDGLQFVVTTKRSDGNASRTQVTFVFNWFEELKRRVPPN